MIVVDSMDHPLMQPHNTPSAAEFNGYYNVPADLLPDERPHLNTFPGPPPLHLDEVKRVSADAYKAIYQHANQKGFTPDEVRNYYYLCISEGLTDRTLNISFMDVEDCTAGLIEQFRRLLATEYPLWRIRIGGTSAETTVVIYPNTVRYGSHPANADGVEAFADALRREVQTRGRPATADQQRAVLKRAIGAAIASGLRESLMVVAGFDNYNGDATKTTLWTLCGGEIADLEMLSPASSMAGDKYRVKPDGDYGYHVSDEAPYWVREWIFPTHSPPTLLQFKAYDSGYQSFLLDVDATPLNS